MPICKSCKHLSDLNYEVAPDRGWCPVWCNWQKCLAKSCKHHESKFQTPYAQQQGGKFKGLNKPRYQKQGKRY